MEMVGNKVEYKTERDVRVEVKGPQDVKGDTERTPEGKLLVKVKPTVPGDYSAQVCPPSCQILFDSFLFF